MNVLRTNSPFVLYTIFYVNIYSDPISSATFGHHNSVCLFAYAPVQMLSFILYVPYDVNIVFLRHKTICCLYVAHIVNL